jgi:hypothetical protein
LFQLIFSFENSGFISLFSQWDFIRMSSLQYFIADTSLLIECILSESYV